LFSYPKIVNTSNSCIYNFQFKSNFPIIIIIIILLLRPKEIVHSMFMWIIFINLYYIFKFWIKKESVSWIYWHNSYNCWFINERIVIQNICQLCRVLSVLGLTALMVLLLVTRAHFWAWYSKTHITCQQPAIRLLHYLSYIYWLKHHMVSYFDKGFILQWKPSLKTKPTFKPTHSSLKIHLWKAQSSLKFSRLHY